VREYATPAAFRAAVEARLRERARRLVREAHQLLAQWLDPVLAMAREAG